MASTFYLLLTGHGKGIFNLMIGSLLLINDEDWFSIILAACVGLTGIFFIALSCIRNLSDEGLDKVKFIYSKNLQRDAEEGIIPEQVARRASVKD